MSEKLDDKVKSGAFMPSKKLSLVSFLAKMTHAARLMFFSYLLAFSILSLRLYLIWPEGQNLFKQIFIPSDFFVEQVFTLFLYSVPLWVGILFLVYGLIDLLSERTMNDVFIGGSKRQSVSSLAKDVDKNTAFDFRPALSDIHLNLLEVKDANDVRGRIWQKKPKDVRLRIPSGLGAGHSLFLGVSGSGKSQLMEAHFDEIRRHQDKAVIVDPGGRYFEKFGRPGDVVLSLYDKRSELVDFWAEEASPDEIAASLIEDRENASGGEEFYSLSPRAVFSGLMDASSSVDELWQILKSMDMTKIKEALLRAESMGSNMLLAKETAGNVMSSLSVKMMWIKHINHWPKKQGKTEPFLISRWAKDDSDDRWVFLISRERDWSFSRHIIRVWFDLLSNSVFSRDFIEGKSRRIYAGCDEISTIGKLESLPKILDKGRKYGYHLLAGLQDVSQFYAAYGQHSGKNIINGFHNRFLYRAAGLDLLQLMEDSCGEGRWLKKIEQIDSRGEKSLSVSEVAKKPFLKDDFLNMPNLRFVIKLATLNPALAEINYVDRKALNPPDMSEIPRPKKDVSNLGNTKLSEKGQGLKTEVPLNQNVEAKDGESFNSDSIKNKKSANHLGHEFSIWED